MLEATLRELKEQLDATETITEELVQQRIAEELDRDIKFRRTEELIRKAFPVGEKRFYCTVNDKENSSVEIICLNTAILEKFLETATLLEGKGTRLRSSDVYIPRFEIKKIAE
jgi:hypothetical protein